MARIDDIVQLSGVSRSTVFRFYNGQNIRSDAKTSIIEAMKQLNYRTDELYKYLNIELEISISSDFESFQGFTKVVNGITSRAEEKGIKVNIARRCVDQMEKDYTNWNNSTTLRGIIVVGKNTNDTLLEADLMKKYGIRHVFVNRIMDDSDISYVAVNLRKAACDMVDHLISIGHDNIAVIGCPSHSQVDEAKLLGYRDAFAKHDLPINNDLIYELSSMDQWEETVRHIFEFQRPSAFFAICDSHAIKLIKFAKDYDIDIPKDMALVGMDDIDMTAYVHPSITTVHVPFSKLGALAVDHVINLLIQEDVQSTKTIVKHHLVHRESC